MVKQNRFPRLQWTRHWTQLIPSTFSLEASMVKISLTKLPTTLYEEQIVLNIVGNCQDILFVLKPYSCSYWNPTLVHIETLQLYVMIKKVDLVDLIWFRLIGWSVVIFTDLADLAWCSLIWLDFGWSGLISRDLTWSGLIWQARSGEIKPNQTRSGQIAQISRDQHRAAQIEPDQHRAGQIRPHQPRSA